MPCIEEEDRKDGGQTRVQADEHAGKEKEMEKVEGKYRLRVGDHGKESKAMGTSCLEVTKVLRKDSIGAVVEGNIAPLEEEKKKDHCRPGDPHQPEPRTGDRGKQKAIDGINKSFHGQEVDEPSTGYQVGCHIFHQENDVNSGVFGMM